MNKINLFSQKAGSQKDLQHKDKPSKANSRYQLTKIKEKAKEVNDSLEMKLLDHN